MSVEIEKMNAIRDEQFISSAEARKNWSSYLDKAMRKPVSVKRREEVFVTYTINQLKKSVPFTLVMNEEKVSDETIGAIHMYFKELPQVIGYGEDIEQAKKDFIFALKDYANIYMDDFESHYYAPNLQGQLLQVNILHDMSIEEAEEFINGKLERLRKVS